MCNGALAHFTVVKRAVAHCFNKVGHPGNRIYGGLFMSLDISAGTIH